MELGGRKRKILQSIVEEYVLSAEPIGSRTIARHTDMGLSSATIRNEMADLEEMGYLISPHTSAGRIPSDAGYRFYVNELMRHYQMSTDEMARLRSFFTAGVFQLDRMIRQVGDIMSQLTSYTTIAVTPEIKRSFVKRFGLIPVDESCVLLVLVTSEGIVKNQLISMEGDEDSLRSLARLLNEKLAGLTLEEINLVKINEIQHMLGANHQVLMPILNFIHDAITEMDGSEVYVSSTQNILKHPEYYNISKARELLGFLESKENLKNAVDQIDTPEGGCIGVVIGKENKFNEMQETSMVTAGYTVAGKLAGRIGIVGPTRMDYAKVVTSLDYITKGLDEIVRQLYKQEEGSDLFDQEE